MGPIVKVTGPLPSFDILSTFTTESEGCLDRPGWVGSDDDY